MIKKQIEKASAKHNAQISLTRYRGHDSQVHVGGSEPHGTYCYRGSTYVK
tara:strand:- start:1 stop:150 length:150 start_codon:yes stop_codon:yes gene_type:complete